MQIGMIGLGRMGANIVRRLLRGVMPAWSTIAIQRWGRARSARAPWRGASLRELVEALAAPRLVWIMLPAGPATEQAIAEVSGLLAARRLHHRWR